MTEPINVYIGFDPGGKTGNDRKGKFGWSICREETGTGRLKVKKVGLGKNAKEVLDRIISELEFQGLRDKVRAAGIDAPLFWTETGFRGVDDDIHVALAGKGSTYHVHTINELQGACLVQGVLLADQLYRELKCLITEVHPGALIRLDKSMPMKIVGLPSNEDKRDATFAAYAAWHIGVKGWQDLYKKEKKSDPILPLGTPVSYWMPIPKQD